MKQTTPDIGTLARTQIAQTLPEALDKAITSYQDYLDNPDGQEANEFKNRHAAYKAALAHIELILKLSDIVNIENDQVMDSLAELLQNAQKELESQNG